MSEPLPTFFKKAVDAAIAKLELGLKPDQVAELVSKISEPSMFNNNTNRQQAADVVQGIILQKWATNQSYTTPFTDKDPDSAQAYSDSVRFSKDQTDTGKKAYLEAVLTLGTIIEAALVAVSNHHEEIASGVSLFHDTDTPKTPANDLDALQAETSRLLKLYADKLGQEQALIK